MIEVSYILYITLIERAQQPEENSKRWMTWETDSPYFLLILRTFGQSLRLLKPWWYNISRESTTLLILYCNIILLILKTNVWICIYLFPPKAQRRKRGSRRVSDNKMPTPSTAIGDKLQLCYRWVMLHDIKSYTFKITYNGSWNYRKYLLQLYWY